MTDSSMWQDRFGLSERLGRQPFWRALGIIMSPLRRIVARRFRWFSHRYGLPSHGIYGRTASSPRGDHVETMWRPRGGFDFACSPHRARRRCRGTRDR